MKAPLSTAEAAEMLGITPQHLRRLIEDGQLVAERVGHHYVVDAASLVVFRQAREAAARIPALPAGTIAQLAQARAMLASFPWDAIRQAQEVLRHFEESGMADRLPAARQADEAMASASLSDTSPSAPPHPRWQQWTGSENPEDAIAKLRARARARTRGTASGNATDILREMREGRHADG